MTFVRLFTCKNCSYDGYGTDAVVYLKALTHDATELLPVFNKTSTKQYKSAIPTADWTDPTFSGANRGNEHEVATQALSKSLRSLGLVYTYLFRNKHEISIGSNQFISALLQTHQYILNKFCATWFCSNNCRNFKCNNISSDRMISL